MQRHQGNVHQHGGRHRLEDTHDDGLFAHALELLQAELIADGEGDEAQRHLRNNIQTGHHLWGVEANPSDIQRPQQVWSKQQARHQVGSDGGQVQFLCQTGHQQATYQTDRQLDQDFHNDTSIFTKKERVHICANGPAYSSKRNTL